MALGDSVSARPTPEASRVEQVERLYAAKSAEELRIAASLVPQADIVPDRGPADARVLLVKGCAGPAEASGLPALDGPDGQAAAAALEALGFDPESVYATVSHPGADSVPDGACAQARSARLRATIEAVDPFAVVALDATAAQDVSVAFGVSAVDFGVASRVGGRTILAVDGLEASLTDEDRKRAVWAQFRSLKPAAPAW